MSTKTPTQGGAENGSRVQKPVSTTSPGTQPEVPDPTTPRRAEVQIVANDDHCSECGGHIHHDETHAEWFCSQCGLIVRDKGIDFGPEWKVYDSKLYENGRVGLPVTELMHDKGLTAGIGHEDRDAFGTELSVKKRRQLRRLRLWDERFRCKNHKERNLRQALGEIKRMIASLSLPESVGEIASVIYRRTLDEDLILGRSIEGVASAAVYAASRQVGHPRTTDEIVDVSRIEKKELERTYRYIVRNLGLQVNRADPEDYLPRFVSELDGTRDLEQNARELVEAGREAEVLSGKRPSGIAAAAIFAAGLIIDEIYTQGTVSDIANVSEVTIRNRYRELTDAAGIEVDATIVS